MNTSTVSAENPLVVLRAGIRARGWQIALEDNTGVIIAKGVIERSYPNLIAAFDALTGYKRIVDRYTKGDSYE